MAAIKVMSAGAVQSMVTALGAEFERETGNRLDLNFNTVGSLRERLQGRRGGRSGRSCRNPPSPRSTSPACSCPAASPISAAPSPAWW